MGAVPEGVVVPAAFGVMLLVASALCRVASIAHRKPESDFWAILGQGSLQRRRDYTAAGWRLYQASMILALGAVGLFGLAIWMQGG
jgi:hypothetical protein